MKVRYTGRRIELSATEQAKLQRRYDKIHRILSRNKDLETHVILHRQRHLFEAEVTLRALQHTLVVSGTGVEPFIAVNAALQKLEKQAARNKHKLIDNHRLRKQRDAPTAVVAETIQDVDAEIERAPLPKPSGGPRIVRSNGIAAKPMTVEGAALALEASGRDHISYRDADSGRLNVLLRRRDGVLELVEAG